MIRISIVCADHGDEIFEVEIPPMDGLDQTITIPPCDRCISDADSGGYHRRRHETDSS